MQHENKILIIGLLLPIVLLVTQVVTKEYNLKSGVEVELPISGYDPRDLLAGHYITYTIDYGVKDLCKIPNNADFRQMVLKTDSYVCLQPKYASDSVPQNCSNYIHGRCNFGRFIAGVERFYVSQVHADTLTKQVMDHNASIVLSVSKNGSAQVKYLLINGERWQAEK